MAREPLNIVVNHLIFIALNIFNNWTYTNGERYGEHIGSLSYLIDVYLLKPNLNLRWILTFLSLGILMNYSPISEYSFVNQIASYARCVCLDEINNAFRKFVMAFRAYQVIYFLIFSGVKRSSRPPSLSSITQMAPLGPCSTSRILLPMSKRSTSSALFCSMLTRTND